MVTRQTKPKGRLPRNPQAPRGQLEAVARRKGGYGYSFTPHVLFRSSRQLDLKPLDLLVLLAILSHASSKATDFCTASFDVLAEDTGLDRKTVVKHVNRLRKELKLLSSSNKRISGTKQTANTYNVQPLAEKLKAMMAEAPQGAAEGEVDLDTIIAELMAEPGGDMDLDEPGGVEVPVSAPRKREGRWASVVKDSEGDEGDDGRAKTRVAEVRSGSPKATSDRASTAAKEAARRKLSNSRSRFRPPELDDADHAQLDRGERLHHPDGRELTVDEHLYRMREMECYTRPRIADILVDLGFPNEEITAAMNAGPVERLGRLAGVASRAPVEKPDVPYQEKLPPELENDPEAVAAYEAINATHRMRWEKDHGKS